MESLTLGSVLPDVKGQWDNVEDILIDEFMVISQVVEESLLIPYQEIVLKMVVNSTLLGLLLAMS